MTTTKDLKPSRAKAEHRALDRVIDRLAVRFPDLAATEIERAVRSEYQQHADSRVRTYLPILIERAVRARLTTTGAPEHAKLTVATY